MKKFLLTLSLFLLPLMLVVFPLNHIITKGLKKTHYGEFAEWNDLFDGRINADILISGSSKAWVQISPKIIEEKTDCSAYNLGMDGHNFYFMNARYLNYQKYNKKPKIIIQQIGSETFPKRKDLLNYQQFLPYLDKEEISNPAYTYQGLSIWDKEIPLYRYMGEFDLIKIGLLEYFNIKHFSNGKFKGYLPSDEKWDGTNFEQIKNSQKKLVINIDAESVRLFEEFLKYCRDSGIKLILVNPPSYAEGQSLYENLDEVTIIIKQLAEKYDTPLLDYSGNYLSKDKKYFFNATHLNKEGAELFSEQLAKDIGQKFNLSECSK